jgi:hypothetical protein
MYIVSGRPNRSADNRVRCLLPYFQAVNLIPRWTFYCDGSYPVGIAWG